ncbi:energy-coupling factor ABC transporter ATP-binding protein [Carboxylicivirga marina]|uniref:ABC transporter ATP-binding protein n=1 Tax=Carboxylicivirga marina TaxID=2800988 RepID=A0ABS1HK67_9BACT|nr:ABC transporter ATP-binding protein [Carboxylicivirga marina]MBK3518069.1 ABC transporter ATP-binding protein [Carboxylicivirga marina]
MDQVLQLRHISYSYSSGNKALQDVSLSVNKGERIALMGANGSGKSSLFLVLTGIIMPNEGHYFLKGKSFRYCRRLRQELCKTIGFVFQDPEVQVVSNQVFEDVAFGLRNMRLSDEEVEYRTHQYLELTGILHLKDKLIHTLSYGQKKQVALAGVLAMEPEVILLDEPFAWLDYRQSKRLLTLLNQLTKMGKTLIVSTHDSEFANQWAQRAWVMKDGALEADLPTENLFNNAQLVDKLDIAPLVSKETPEVLSTH